MICQEGERLLVEHDSLGDYVIRLARPEEREILNQDDYWGMVRLMAERAERTRVR